MKAFVCKVCTFVSLNEGAPEKCPVCNSPQTVFEFKEDAINTPADKDNLTDFEKKHIPLVNTPGECSLLSECLDINSTVGEITHPMDSDHFIHHLDFYVNNKFITRVIFSPEKVFASAGIHSKLIIKKISVVESCTKHGKWIGEQILSTE